MLHNGYTLKLSIWDKQKTTLTSKHFGIYNLKLFSQSPKEKKNQGCTMSKLT